MNFLGLNGGYFRILMKVFTLSKLMKSETLTFVPRLAWSKRKHDRCPWIPNVGWWEISSPTVSIYILLLLSTHHLMRENFNDIFHRTSSLHHQKSSHDRLAWIENSIIGGPDRFPPWYSFPISCLDVFFNPLSYRSPLPKETLLFPL